jgi:hypothetical protein
VSGEVDLALHLPLGTPAERFEKLLLDAWRRGVKAMKVIFDPNLSLETVKAAQPAVVRRKATAKMVSSNFLHTKAPVLPKRHSRSSGSRLGGMSHNKPKSRHLSKSH